MTNSLGDYIQDRTESLDSELIKTYFIKYDEDKIARMIDGEQYLVEGSRGVGKTMLMKYSEIVANSSFEKNNVLVIWVSFEESIRLERIKIKDDNKADPFLQWTMGKILLEILKKVETSQPSNLNNVITILQKIFGSNNLSVASKYNEYVSLLNEYIKALECADIIDNNSLESIAPSTDIISILDNPRSFKDFILKMIDDLMINRIVLMFDEAAHVFSEEQQIKFFTFFKSLRDNRIACKAAVYPGITNYGKYFEKNQDAKEIKLDWNVFEKKDITYIYNIIKKRVQSYDSTVWNKLTSNKEIINTICAASNGNPRFAFHIIDEMQNKKLFDKKSISIQDLTNCIRTVSNEKWKDFSTLRQRMVRYSDYVTNAEKIVKEVFLINLREWNNRRRKENKKLSVGFYVEELTYNKIEKIFNILAYANIICIDDVKKSIGHNKYGYFISINPSFLFSDLIIRDYNELLNISNNIDNNQVYSDNNPMISAIISNVTETMIYKCSNNDCDFTTNDESYRFCKKCGSPMEKIENVPLYKLLRDHPLDNLALSDAIKNRLKTKFSTIGEIYDASETDIRMNYIAERRIEKIKNAAIEYMAG